MITTEKYHDVARLLFWRYRIVCGLLPAFHNRMDEALGPMTDRIRIIKHEAIPDCGSYEVEIPGKPSVYFYWENNAGRRLRPEQMTGEQALDKARHLARTEQDRLDEGG